MTDDTNKTPVTQVEQPQQSTPQQDSSQPEQKDWMVALLLSIFLGQLGIDRFYMGLIGTGILKLITCGGCGVWWLIDIILIANNDLKDSNGLTLKRN